MYRFPDLVARHRVDPGHLLHVGAHGGQAVPFYYEAGFSHITVVNSDPSRAKVLRTRFPGIEVLEAMWSPGEARWLDVIAPSVKTAVISDLGNEMAILSGLPWDTLDLLIVTTSATKVTEFTSPYDLVTEAVTTRGFVEVERWTRDDGGGTLDVAFMRGARL